jgi:hypothetical protein
MAVARIRERANRNPELLAQLKRSLGGSNADHLNGEQELRTAIKRRSRRLIHVAFLAMVSDGVGRVDALRVARAGLAEFAIAESWRARPVIKSFLDCAEIAVAVSLAYDWLYQELSDEERDAIEGSLRCHVLDPARAAYDDRFVLWPKRRDNCCLVSNAGILLSALAALGRFPDASARLIRKSFASSWTIFDLLAPDGAWPEGLSYWSLAMRYAGLMVAALESTFGQSFGLADRPGLALTGDFALHAAGPFGAAFNFADSETRFDLAPLAWFAHRFKRPIDAKLIDRYRGWYLPFTAIWPDRPKSNPKTPKTPTGKVFNSGNLACFRNTWSTDPAARPVFIAIKGGNVFAAGAAASARPEDVILHSQADAGSFVVDGARQRWIIDLGPDDYDLPGYFDHGADDNCGLRWRYYRTQTAGHNTLVINGRNQIPNARATIIGSCSGGRCKWAVFDLSAAYGKPAGSIRRGAALIGRQVMIEDEVSPDISGTIVWAFHTCAEPVSLAGSEARFCLGDDRFVVRILEPAAARLEIVFPPEPRSFPIADVRALHGRSVLSRERPMVFELPRRVDDPGQRAGGALVRRLQIVWPAGTRRLRVALLPDCDDNDDNLLLPVAPLNDWLASRPMRLARLPRPEYEYRARRARRNNSPEPSSVFGPLEAGVPRQRSPQRTHYA